MISGRVSAASLALLVGLIVSVAFPSPSRAATWAAYSFSSAEEDKMLTFINQLRVSSHSCTYGSTSKCTAPALISVSTLHSKAESRSQRMYDGYNDHPYFSHSIPSDGHNVFDELTAMGYCWTAAGEDIAMNTASDADATQVAFDGWTNSEGHYNVMVSTAYTVVGIGVFKGDGRDHTKTDYWNGNSWGPWDSTSQPNRMYTAVFAKPCSSATPTPRPTPTPTPRPTPTPTPTPTPKPTATSTPRPTATPTPAPTPAPTPRPTPSPTPRPSSQPGPTPAPTTGSATPTPVSGTATPAASFDAGASPPPGSSFGPGGGGLAGPTFASGSAEPLASDGSFASNDPGASTDPSGSAGGVAGGAGDGPSLEVVEPVPAFNLIDAVVTGVASTYFGH